MTDSTLVRRLQALNGHHHEPIGTLASAVEPESVAWLWPGRLALGKFSTCDGDPGLGKSTLTLEIAARLSRGEALPGAPARRPCGVVLLNAEDGAADTIVPRLMLAGADLDRVYVMQGVRAPNGEESGVSLAAHIDAVERAIATVGARLLVVDPLLVYLGGETNAHRDQDVRRVLAPLAAMLDRTKCAGVLLRHLNKAQAVQALYRGGGSIGIVGAARFGWLVARDDTDPEARIVATVKCNIGPEPPALRYWLRGVPGTDHARVEWDDQPCAATAQSLLAAAAESEEERSTVEEAAEWLADFLAGGPERSTAIYREGQKEGYQNKTLKRAKALLGAKAVKEGFGSEGRWVWALPKDLPPDQREMNLG